jgi:hypothetical protein
MPPAGFKPAIPASERPKNYALNYTATGISNDIVSFLFYRLHQATFPVFSLWSSMEWSQNRCKCLQEQKILQNLKAMLFTLWSLEL